MQPVNVAARLSLRISILFLALLSCSAFGASDDLVAILKSNLSKQAAKVVEFSGRMEYWTAYSPYDPTKATYPIEMTGYASVTTTVAMSGSPLILHEQHPLGCSITDPNYPKGRYFESSNTFAYNGSYWAKLEDDADHAVLSKQPQSFIQPYVTGLAYVTPFCQIESYNNESLIQVLADKQAVFRASEVQVNGEKLLCLDFSRPELAQRETVLLDPLHGYALREHKTRSSDGNNAGLLASGKDCTVSGYVAAGGGVWLPAKIDDEMKADGAACTRVNFSIENAHLISNRTIEELTMIPIPKSWHVDDQRNIASQ